jgi:flagellar hook-basal body complex protein FliE
MQIGRSSPLTPLQPLRPHQPREVPAVGDAPRFSQLLAENVMDVNRQQQTSEKLVHQLLTGENVNQAEVLTAVQKADLSFQLMLQIRNKLMEAYQQLTNMQI